MKDFARKLYRIYKPFRKNILVMLMFIVSFQAASLISPVIHGKILDLIVGKQPFSKVLIFTILSLVIYLVQNAVSLIRDNYELNHFDLAVPRHVSKITLKTILGFSIGQHNNEHSGIKQSMVNRGEHSVMTLAYTLAYEILPMAVHTLLSAAVLIYLGVELGFIVSAAICLFIVLSVYMNRAIKDDLKAARDMRSENDKIYSEIIRNIDIVMINAREKQVASEYDTHLLKLSALLVKMWKKYCSFSALRDLVPIISRFIVITTGAYYVLEGRYTPGYLVILIGWISNAFGHLHSVSNLHRRCAELYADASKYFEMLDVRPEVEVIKNPIRPENFQGRIEFKGVTFSYPRRCYISDSEAAGEENMNPANVALKNVSFVIEPGQRVAFVGHSGAGKTTIAQLIVRAYDPEEGQIIIDSDDLRLLDLEKFREAIGITEQDVRLFDNTLRYNIIFGLNGTRESVTDKDLHRVARLTCIDRFYHRLEKGFDTLIGEKGIKLSGGERQRVGIARALIKEPQFLIFDEATSNLDPDAEGAIREAIDNVSRGRTTIIIAHRLSTIRNVDRIFVLEEGRMVGSGTHEELLKNCGSYQNIISRQIF